MIFWPMSKKHQMENGRAMVADRPIGGKYSNSCQESKMADLPHFWITDGSTCRTFQLFEHFPAVFYKIKASHIMTSIEINNIL